MNEKTYKRKIVKELKEIKENLTSNCRRNYNNIYNTCVDCDNLYGEPYLCSYISDQEFVFDEDMEYLVKKCDNDIDRLRCFIGDTYSDDIYKLDGYANLKNVDIGDFEDLCDELIDILKDNIKTLSQNEM